MSRLMRRLMFCVEATSLSTECTVSRLVGVSILNCYHPAVAAGSNWGQDTLSQQRRTDRALQERHVSSRALWEVPMTHRRPSPHCP